MSNQIDKIILNGTQYDLPSGGGSGITGITMNDSAVTVTSGVANLGTVVTDKSDKQDVIDATHKLSADLVDDTTATNKFVTTSDKSTWSGKQDALVSGTNIKTINNESILGSGNITIQGGGGTAYTAGAGIDITNHIISNTRPQRVFVDDDLSTGIHAGLKIISPKWESNEMMESNLADCPFFYNVPAEGADPYSEDNFLDGELMEFEITDYNINMGSEFTFQPSQVTDAVIYGYDDTTGTWVDGRSYTLTASSFDVGQKYRLNEACLMAMQEAMQEDMPYSSMEFVFTEYFWNGVYSSNAIHNGVEYPLAYEENLRGKQDALVSGHNIKTINDESILGRGNIDINVNYLAGEGISLNGHLISNTREQRVLTFEDSTTGVNAAMMIISPHWEGNAIEVTDPATNLTYVNNVPAEGADPYTQANFFDGEFMEFEIIECIVNEESQFEFLPAGIAGAEMYLNAGEEDWWEATNHTLYPDGLYGQRLRMNQTCLEAFKAAMQADCPYISMTISYPTYVWSTDKSANAIHSGVAYPLAYNSDLTALAARVTALETALGQISSQLDAINGEVV